MFVPWEMLFRLTGTNLDLRNLRTASSEKVSLIMWKMHRFRFISRSRAFAFQSYMSYSKFCSQTVEAQIRLHICPKTLFSMMKPILMNESMNTSKMILCLPNMGADFFLISLHWVIINLFFVFCTQRKVRYCLFKAEANKTKYWYKRRKLYFSEIERKAIIRNRYNYPTPPIRDIKGKDTQTRNNWGPNGNITSRKPNGQLLSHKVAKWLSKTKRCKRNTHSYSI